MVALSAPLISVIVSTYNRAGALRRVLEAYTVSTHRDFEVVVADDGSEPDTAEMVDAVAREAPYRLSRVWQPHAGFRLAAARNLAVRTSRGSILVFTDGDCLPFPDALEAHARRCLPGKAHTGARCFLSCDETARLLQHEGEVEPLFALARRREAGRLRRLRLKNRLYAWSRTKPRPKLITANAAVRREDFERVNGFDERFTGWGYEDEDLARRLRRAGVRILDGSLESLVLHLFHPVDESHRPNARAGANYRYFKRGEFLTCPLLGLSRRAVEDLRLEVLGDSAPPTISRLDAPAPGRRPDVSLIFGRRSLFGSRPRGDVVLRIPRGLDLADPEDCYRFLRERL